MDPFSREEKVNTRAFLYLAELQCGKECETEAYEDLAREYNKLLGKLRRMSGTADVFTAGLAKDRQKLSKKVHIDDKTGIFNRRYLDDKINFHIKELSRASATLSVLMLDIDYFKKYNDCYGHIIGDECLKSVAEAMQACIERDSDFVARYGGEEFAVVLPNADKDGACRVAEKIRKHIEMLDIRHEKSDVADCITVSIGVTTGKPTYKSTCEDFFERADKALYRSKNNGRNQYKFEHF
jgi:diguanylate cyclase (GGDEF)-like protein